MRYIKILLLHFEQFLEQKNRIFVWFSVIKNTWDEYMEYRLNFVMWRFRQVLRILIIYFLWWSIIAVKKQIFGYDETTILTYTLLVSVVTSIVFSTRTQDIGLEINRGDLSNLLLKPTSTFSYWVARDIGDKLLNILFSIFEFIILILLLHPNIFIQQNPFVIILTLVSILISIALFFMISLLLSFIGFWSPDVWAPRFLFFVILDFFSGGLFPLDILPNFIYQILKILPFNYLLFFPIKLYLGQFSTNDIYNGLLMSLVWLLILFYITRLVWHRGLKVYEAYGR